MCTADLQLGYRQQCLKLEGQPGPAILFQQAEALEVRTGQAEAPARQLIGDQRASQIVIAVDDHLTRTAEDPMLRQMVGRQIGIAIHMIFTDVQYRGHLGVQRLGGFELEAGQFQHVQIGALIEQIKRRRPDIAAHRHLPAGLLGHGADQGGHGALGVGAGDRHDWRSRLAGEQFDVADYPHTSIDCRLDRRCGQGDARIDDQLAGTAQQLCVQLAQMQIGHGREALELVQPRRIGAGVANGKRQITASQVPGNRQAGRPESDYDPLLVRSDQ